jgi:hypothetical protein
MSRRRHLVAALAVVGVSALSVAVSGNGSGGDHDPVRKTVAFLGGTQSASFEGSLQVVLPQGTTQDNGVRGNIQLPDRSREFLLDEDQIITIQVIAVGGRVYEARSGLPSTYEVGPAVVGHTLNLWRPAELRQLVGRLEAVTISGRTIRGRVPVSALVAAPLGGQADVELTVDSRSRPERMRWQMEVASAGTVRVNGDVAYKEWTARKADIAVPEEIDNTPDVDEDEVAAFQSGPVLAPTKLPVGYELSNLFLADGAGVNCPRAELDYFQADRYFARFTLRVPAVKAPRLSIEMQPRSCRAEPLPDGTPFTAGPIQGTVAQAPTLPGDEPFRFFTADAGTFRIRVETNLTQDEVLAAIGSLAPIDLATQPVHQGRDINEEDPLAILDFLVRYTLPAA